MRSAAPMRTVKIGYIVLSVLQRYDDGFRRDHAMASRKFNEFDLYDTRTFVY